MKTNLLLTAISIGSRLLSGLLIFVVLARMWEPAQFGSFVFVFSTATLLALLVDFGLSGYLLREIGAEPSKARDIFSVSLWAKLALIVIYVIASGITYLIAGSTVVPWEVFLPLLLSTLSFSFADFFIAPLRALGRFGVETSIVTSSNLLHFCIVVSIAWLVGTSIAVACAMMVGRLILLAIAVSVTTRIVPGLVQRYCGINTLTLTFKRVLPYGTDSVLTSIWNQADIVLVRALYGPQGVGLYAAGQKIVEGAVALAPVIGNVMIPRLSRLNQQRSNRFTREARTALIMMFMVGIAFGIPLVFFAEPLIQVVFGERYTDLVSFLPYFATILMVRYATAGAGVIITALGLQSKRVLGQFLGLSTFALISLIVYFLTLPIKTFLLGYAFAFLTILAVYGAVLRKAITRIGIHSS